MSAAVRLRCGVRFDLPFRSLRLTEHHCLAPHSQRSLRSRVPGAAYPLSLCSVSGVGSVWLVRRDAWRCARWREDRRTYWRRLCVRDLRRRKSRECRSCGPSTFNPSRSYRGVALWSWHVCCDVPQSVKAPCSGPLHCRSAEPFADIVHSLRSSFLTVSTERPRNRSANVRKSETRCAHASQIPYQAEMRQDSQEHSHGLFNLHPCPYNCQGIPSKTTVGCAERFLYSQLFTTTSSNSVYQ